MNPRALGAALAVALCAACAPREPAPLVDHGLWDALTRAEDPWAADAPPEEDVSCGPLAVYAEELGGEPSVTVALSDCNYVVLSQPSLVEALDGDVVTLRLWRDALYFPSDGVRLALGLDAELVWETTVPAPGDSGLELHEIALTADLPEGSPIRLLVDTGQDLGARHGGDSFNVIEISRAPPDRGGSP